MKTVGDILNKKGGQVYSTTPHATVFDALNLMADHNVGALLVLDGKTIAGVVSERDYARKVILQGKSSRELPVSEVMSSRVITVTPSETMDGCMALMTDKHIRHLPVLDENAELVGLVSIGDVVKGLIEEKLGEIRQLENYIYGVQ